MGPIRGETRPLPVAMDIMPQHVDANLNASIHNRFDIEVIDAKTGELKQLAQAENVICKGLWECLFSSAEYDSRYFYAISFGTGSGTPASTDTALFTLLNKKAFPTGSYNYVDFSKAVITTDKVNHVYSLKHSIQLSETEFNGSTLTEVGLSGSNGKLCSHAMLKDMNGNPISIAKTGTDIINIYATIFVHWLPAYNGNRMQGASNGLLTCASGQRGYGLVNDIKQIYLGGTGDGCETPIVKTCTIAYDLANKKAALTMPRLATGEGNFGNNGIGYISTYEAASDCIYFDQIFANPFDVTNEATATGDGTTKDFSTGFGFLAETGTTVYVDGVASSPVIDSSMPVGGNVGTFFRETNSSGVLTGSPAYRCFAKVITSGNSDNDFGGRNTVYAYNPYWENLGLNTVKYNTGSITLHCSNDCVTWVSLNELVTADSLAINGKRIPEAYVHYKYWKLIGLNGYSYECCNFKSDIRTNIHFATAPANGAVITSTYKTKHIPKDVNHVFDFSFSVTVGEKVI